MDDFCVGHIPVASGIFGLEHTQGHPTLTFAGISRSGPGPRAPYRVNLPVVANPKSIATTLDEEGFTNLLVCGDGILHIASQNCIDSSFTGTVLPATISHDTLTGIRKIQVAQQGRDLALWSLNSSNNLVGLSSQLKVNDDGCDELTETTAPVPLLSKADVLQTYDIIVQPQTKSQQVLCLKRNGAITCLHQTGDSKLVSISSCNSESNSNI